MSDVIRFPTMVQISAHLAQGGTFTPVGELKMSDLYGTSDCYAQTTSASQPLPFMLDSASSTIAPEIAQGWSNQELADLYRTQRLLALAGITTVVDRGLSDEGDPWFIFMDARGEVFVHFSRLDGLYMVASQVQDKPVWGDSLANLVTEFSKWVQPARATTGGAQNVISIAGRSRNGVLVHPAASLAALVWSIYLISDDLVATTALAPASDLHIGDIGEHSALTDHSADISVLPDLSQKAMVALSDPALLKQVADPYLNREVSTAAPISIMSSGISMKAVGLGLSLAAISMGLPLDNNTENTNPQDHAPQLSIAQLYTLLTQAKEAAITAVAAIEIFADPNTPRAMPQGITAAVTPALEVEMQAFETSVEFAEVMQAVTASYKADIDALMALSHQITAHVPQDTPDPVQTAAAAIPVLQKDTPDLVVPNLLLSFDKAFESFALTKLDTLTLAQTDLGQLMALTPAAITLADDATAPDLSAYTAFDDSARMFLDFLLRTYNDIKVVTLPTELIFIHVDAFDSAGVDQPIYAKSWSFDDGGVISTIGLKSDLELFDLIA